MKIDCRAGCSLNMGEREGQRARSTGQWHSLLYTECLGRCGGVTLPVLRFQQITAGYIVLLDSQIENKVDSQPEIKGSIFQRVSKQRVSIM